MSKAIEFLKDDVKRSVLLLAVSAVSLVLSFAGIPEGSPVDVAWVAIILCGAPILWDAATGLVLRHDIKADVLVAMAIIAAVCLGEWFAAGEVALIMQIGGLLEDISAAKANKGIERLVSMTPRTARVVRGDSAEEVPADSVSVGDTVRVLPGEAVPVDGVVTRGETSIDQSVMTGESMPVDKCPGDPVYSGTINQMGAFEMRVTRSSEDSSFQTLARMVSSVDADKTRMVRIADRWATWLVAIVMVLAVVTYAVTQDIYRAVTVMIVFCPCAFILATPTAVVAAIGNLTRHGILVKDGDSLERMASVDVMAFDKTGTLTEGRPEVVDVSPVMDRDGFVRLVSSAESGSQHPLAKAFVFYARENGLSGGPSEGFRMTVGRGISAKVDGREVLAGNPRMMAEAGVTIPSSASSRAEEFHGMGCTTVFVAVDGDYAGSVTFSDRIRGDSASTVSELKAEGVDCILLTGDNDRAASFISSTVGIGEHRSECTPVSKMEAVSGLESQGRKVCMIGDGVNDAPALRKAWVGIAVGSGSDIAVDAADMALVGDGIGDIPHLVGVSRRMVSKVRWNIAFSMCWNFMAVALAMFAVLGPVAGALVHNVGSVAVVANSALLLFYGRRRSKGSPEDAPAAERPAEA